MDEKRRRFQQYLSLIRCCAGWSAAVLGDKLEVTRQMISNLETGQNRMTMVQYRALRHAFLEEILLSPSDTQMLRDVLQVLVDEPDSFPDSLREQALADANLLAPSVSAKKTTRKKAADVWSAALAGAVIADINADNRRPT